MTRVWLSVLTFAAAGSLAAATIEMDSGRGQRIFESAACVQCHALNGKGGHVASDLGRAIDRNFTPATLASTMWNHAPTMWSAMEKQNVKRPGLDAQGAADLFAYFYSAHYFDKPGDAGRGKRLFHERSCDSCHGITNSPNPAAPPVAKWQALADPIELTGAMWNHSGAMYAEMQSKKMAWPEISGQDLSDLLVYIRNLPSVPTRSETFITTSGSKGAMLFETKGCKACHDPSMLLYRTALDGRTLIEVSAALWDHAPRMKTPPAQFGPHEMRELLSYLWANQFFTVNGNAEHGKKVFAAKRCAACHDDPSSGAPDLSKQTTPANGSEMVAVLWLHGPSMMEQMKKKGIKWPHFEARDMADVIAFLNSRRK